MDNYQLSIYIVLRIKAGCFQSQIL